MNGLSDNDIFFELAAIFAGMGDTHTKVVPPDSLYDYLFPFGVSYFDGREIFCAYFFIPAFLIERTAAIRIVIPGGSIY